MRQASDLGLNINRRSGTASHTTIWMIASAKGRKKSRYHRCHLVDLENRRMALLLEEAQRLMAERDPAALIRQVCAAARPLTQASIVGVGIVGDDGTIDDFVAVGLDDDHCRGVAAVDGQQPRPSGPCRVSVA